MPVMPGVTWRPVPSHSGLMRAHLGLVEHVQVGDGSCYGEFSVPANQASSTWWVPKHGVIGDLSFIEQYVDSDYIAWTQAAGNPEWNAVENEGTPDEPLTDYQVWANGQIFKWGHDTYGWPFQLSEDPNTRGLGWHGMGGTAWGGHFDCPGELRKAQRPDILNIAQGDEPLQPDEKMLLQGAYDNAKTAKDQTMWLAGVDPDANPPTPTGGGVPHIEKMLVAICKQLKIDPNNPQ